jgi:Fe-S oxidoreductase/nitrate reductase gamma subunit
MDASRAIYWNVGSGVELPMYIFTALAVLVCAYGFYRRISVYRQGRPVIRTDQMLRRLAGMLKAAFGHGKVARVKGPGLTHAALFWGIVLLFIGTLLIMIEVDLTRPFFHVDFLQGWFYKFYSLTLDIAGLISILTMAGFAARRFFVAPPGLKVIRDDYAIHIFLFVILGTGFIVEGLRIAATELTANPALALWSPVGRLIALSLTPLGNETLRSIHRIIWWVHFASVMGLIAILPSTKLRHLMTTPANMFFGDLRPKGSIPSIDLTAEGVTTFGAGAAADLTWKDIFDADACMSCKRCQDVCPAWATDKPLSPMRIVQQIGQMAVSEPRGDLIAIVTADALWACTTCRACQDICPAEVEHVNKIIEMRRNLVLMRGEFPGQEVVTAMNNLEVNFNPFGTAYASRGDWADGLPVVRLDGGDEPIDILYFVGCFGSFDKRNQDVARSFVRVCAAAGIRVGILGKMEKCCGEPLRKLGNEYLYQQVAVDNIARISAAGVSRIVTTCPHCFNTLGVDYRDMGFDIEVEHSTTFLERLMREGALTLAPETFEATYHDSCYLGRYRDILEEPRELLRGAGGRITEMQRSGCDSVCCGAGGGRILAEERLGTRINAARITMAAETKSPLLVSSCPFCLTMFEDGIKTGGLEETLRVRDLVEVIEERSMNNNDARQGSASEDHS